MTMNIDRRQILISSAALTGVAAIGLVPSRAQEHVPATASRPTAEQAKTALLDDARPRVSKLGVDKRLWNWRRDTGIDPRPANYYEASLTDWRSFPTLSADQSVDVVVIGGGLLGASAALHLAKAGLEVARVERDNIGSGASGRNGGQLTPGVARWEAGAIAASLSPDEARRLWRFAGAEAMDLIDSLSADHGFEADRKRGHITAAIHSGHLGALVESADARRTLGDASVDIIGPHQLQDYVRSPTYFGAAIDSLGGQIHPLALLRGLVDGFIAEGGRVFENTAVTGYEQTSRNTRVITEAGTLTARKAVVMAVHNGTPKLLEKGATTMPFYTYVAVTPPLPVPVKDLLPGDLPVYDTQFQIDYYRAVRRNRILFGGQGTGNSWSARDVNNYLTGRLRAVFPQLEKPELEYSWGGISDMTVHGATDARKLDGAAPLYAVHGWSGHGVAQTVRIGKAISDDVTGANDDYAMLTALEHMTVPFGETIGPFVTPIGKAAYAIRGFLNPAEMISF